MAVEAIISKALELIIELTAPHVLRYLRPIWGGVDGDLEKLRRYLLQIQPLVEDAEERQLMDQVVKSWLMLLRDVAYDADDVLDQANTHVLLIQRKAQLYGTLKSKVRDFFSLHHNPLLFQLQLGDKLTSINKRIHVIIAEMHKFNFRVVDNNSNNDNRPWRNRPQTHSYVPESEVIGRDEDRDVLVKMLINDQFEEKVAVVSIVGMGGLGKTTLAQLVCGDENVKRHFESCTWWVCVSDDFDVAKLTKNIILAATGKSYDHANMEVLQRDLRQLLGQKRYLLVLDDVWNEDHRKWDALKNLLLDGGEGSRILVTTRNEKCSRIMGARKSYTLQGLSEESSWALFEKRAFTINVSRRQPKLVEIGKEIVNRCKGLPLAIKVMGSVMYSKSEESQWQAVLDNQIWDFQHAKDEIRPELWLSYVDLPSHLKKCFAFCAIFPKDHHIEVNMLIQFWMAHGFITSTAGKDMEVEGHEIFNELVWRSLLRKVTKEEGGSHHNDLQGKRYCKMHDLIHDLAQFVTGDECFTMLTKDASLDISKRVRHLTLIPDVEGCVNYDLGDCPSIRTALSVGRGFTALPKLKLARVLGLHFSAKVGVLSASIEHLHHLRYLDLSCTHINKLPESICMLVNLQTLNLNACGSLTELPQSIIYMTSLRHLYISDCIGLKTMPSGLSRLGCLKTLTKYIVAEKAGNKIGELKHLNLGGELRLCDLHKVKNGDEAKEANLSGKQNLYSLDLCWGASKYHHEFENVNVENAKEVLEALKPHNGLKVLKLRGYPGKQFPMWMRDQQQLQNLVKISLAGYRECEHLPPLEQLPFLEVLILRGMGGIKSITNFTSSNALPSFPSLRKLSLHGMNNLEWRCVNGDRESAPPLFPCLIEMKIVDCPKLTPISHISTLQELILSRVSHETEIPPISREVGFFKHLESLWLLEITNFDEIAQLLEDEEETRAMSLSLRELFISGCRQLSLTRALRNLSSLKVLAVWRLEKLVSWPDESFRGLRYLKVLTIFGCKNLTGASSPGDCFPPCLEELQVIGCDALIELPKCPTSLQRLEVWDCPSIESLWPEMGHLISLKELLLINCPKLGSLSDGMQGLTSLQHLSIVNCLALKSFPEGLQERLPTLKKLKIKGCPELQSRCNPGGDYWHFVSDISERDISSLTPDKGAYEAVKPWKRLLTPCL